MHDDEQAGRGSGLAPAQLDRLARLLRRGEDGALPLYLEDVLDAVVELSYFDAVVLHVADASGDLVARAVRGPDELASLRDTRLERHRFDEHLARGEGLGTLRVVRVPRPAGDRDRWLRGDAVMAPLTARDGTLLGCLSLDHPRDARHPDASRRGLLELIATHAALVLDRHRRLDALRTRREGIEHVLARLAGAYAVLDEGLRLVEVNGAFAELVGGSPATLQHAPLESVVDVRDRELVLSLCTELLASARGEAEVDHRLRARGDALVVRTRLERFGTDGTAGLTLHSWTAGDTTPRAPTPREHPLERAMTVPVIPGARAEVERALSRRRDPGVVALLWLELSSHGRGDELERSVAQAATRVRAVLRGDASLVGARENVLVVLCEGPVTGHGVESLARRLVEAAAPSLPGIAPATSCNIGIAFAGPGAKVSAGQLLDEAHEAYETSLTLGPGNWHARPVADRRAGPSR